MSRTETDSLGPIDVPDEAYWGAQTQRSLINFAIGQERMPLPVVHALALIKKAAARVNQRIGELPADLARLIEQAANEVLAGQHDEQFPLVVWQTGSGTQSNMNVNEVIAGRANELAGNGRGGKTPVHPNDHVNRAQSSNDSFPTAMHIAAAQAVQQQLLPAIRELRDGLGDQARRFFARPLEEKMRFYIGQSSNHSGYVPEGEEQFVGGSKDLKQSRGRKHRRPRRTHAPASKHGGGSALPTRERREADE